MLVQCVLQHLELVHFVGFSIDNVHGASNAGVERVDCAQDFNRALGIGHRRANKSFFGSADVAVGWSLGVTLGFLLLCLGVVAWIFRTGYKLKA